MSIGVSDCNACLLAALEDGTFSLSRLENDEFIEFCTPDLDRSTKQAIIICYKRLMVYSFESANK